MYKLHKQERYLSSSEFLLVEFRLTAHCVKIDVFKTFSLVVSLTSAALLLLANFSAIAIRRTLILWK